MLWPPYIHTFIASQTKHSQIIYKIDDIRHDNIIYAAEEPNLEGHKNVSDILEMVQYIQI